MKGLIVKDCILLKKYSKSFLVSIVLFYVIFAVVNKSVAFANGMLTLFAASLTISTFSYDAMSKWDIYALSMPVTRKQLVQEKYILAIFLSGCGAILAVIIGVVSVFVAGEDFMAQLAVGAVLFMTSLAFLSVTLPLIFKFGPEKGRLCMIITAAFTGILFVGAAQIGSGSLSLSSLKIVMYLSPILCAALFMVSLSISIYFYSKKEF